MPEDSYDILRRALLSALGPRPSPERRRQVAADLRSLAEQQERMAARVPSGQPGIEDRQPRAEPGARASGPAGFYVRIKPEQDPQTGVLRVRLSLGQQVWMAIGSPERIEIQRVGPNIWIVPAAGGAGARLATGAGLPSCVVDRAGPLARLQPGRYAASVQAGALVVGERVA